MTTVRQFGAFGVATMVVGLTMIGSQLAVADEYEEPDYTVVEEREGYEIRQYGPMVLLTYEADGSMMKAMNKSFFPLADYIGGENATETEIAMTAPVIAMPADADEGKLEVDEDRRLNGFRVAFVMPAEYTLDELPAPMREDTTLEAMDGMTVAAVRFSGFGGSGTMEDKWEDLQKQLEADDLTITGPPIFAKYDPPWTLPWKRRNEVLVPVEIRKQ